MTLFEDYRPRPSGERAAPAASVVVDLAQPGDAPAVAALSAARNGIRLDQALPAVQKQLAESSSDGQLFCAGPASADGRCVEPWGYARVARLELAGLPAGWYLAGLVVAPERRRTGIGRALTEHRIAWLAERTPMAYYFASLQNRASLDLHARLGFEQLQRDIAVPGCTFTGGVGVLYGRSL